MSVTVSRDGDLQVLALDNAARANSLRMDMLDRLVEGLRAASDDPSVRGVLLHAADNAGFCAGMDTSLFETDDPDRAYEVISRLGDVCAAVKECAVPVAVAMRRYVIGGSLEIAAAADFRVAAPGTFFQMPEVRIGIPSVLETVNLHRLMGWTLATEIVLTGDRYDAEVMLDRGYLNRIADDPESECRRLLGLVGVSSREVIAQQKRLHNKWRNLPEQEAIDDTKREFAHAFRDRSR